MDSIVQTGKYDDINMTDNKTIQYYVINYVLDTYKLQEDTKCEVELVTLVNLLTRLNT